MIDAKELYEFVESYDAMCKETGNCAECKLQTYACFDLDGLTKPTLADLETIIETVENWKTKQEKELLRHESTAILNEFVNEAEKAIDGLRIQVEGLKKALEDCSEKFGEVFR